MPSHNWAHTDVLSSAHRVRKEQTYFGPTGREALEMAHFGVQHSSPGYQTLSVGQRRRRPESGEGKDA